MGDAHLYDPCLDPNMQGECSVCGGRPDDPAHRDARTDVLKAAAAHEIELVAEMARLTGERAEARGMEMAGGLPQMLRREASRDYPQPIIDAMRDLANIIEGQARAALAKIGGAHDS